MNRQEILEFAEKFMVQSSEFTEKFSSPSDIAIGPKKMRIFSDHSSKVSSLINEAFLKGEAQELVAQLEIWNSSTGVNLPDLFWSREFKNEVFEVHELDKTNWRVAIDRSQGFIYVFNMSTGRGSIWIREIFQVNLASFITPFRLFISWVANSFSGEIVHASAIEINGKGILINGPSGSGKSTLAIFAALQGNRILADDVVLVYEDRLYAIYSRCKLVKNEISPNVESLGAYAVQDFDSLKQVIPINSFRENFVTESSFDGIVFPLIAQMDVSKKIGSNVALRLFAPNSLSEIFGGTRKNFFNLAKMVNSHPCYRQGLSGNLNSDLEILYQIVEDISVR
jgi:hypothetical protein